jgi:hypothetical protein
MVVTIIELERASIIERIEIFEVGKFRRDGNRSLLTCLTIEDLDFMAVFFKGGGKIGQPDRLCPNGSLIKILDGWLNEQDLHILYKDSKINISFYKRK